MGLVRPRSVGGQETGTAWAACSLTIYKLEAAAAVLGPPDGRLQGILLDERRGRGPDVHQQPGDGARAGDRNSANRAVGGEGCARVAFARALRGKPPGSRFCHKNRCPSCRTATAASRANSLPPLVVVSPATTGTAASPARRNSSARRTARSISLRSTTAETSTTSQISCRGCCKEVPFTTRSVNMTSLTHAIPRPDTETARWSSRIPAARRR